jgi:ABC-type branched-subunit amino acid transport system permease subunit
MLFLKLALIAFATICVLVIFTVAWVVARTPGRSGSPAKTRARPDRSLCAVGLTLHSPLYWLLALAILAAAGWLCRRWVFPG